MVSTTALDEQGILTLAFNCMVTPTALSEQDLPALDFGWMVSTTAWKGKPFMLGVTIGVRMTYSLPLRVMVVLPT